MTRRVVRKRALSVLAAFLALAAVMKAASGIGGAMAQATDPAPAPRPVAVGFAPPDPGILPDLVVDLATREAALTDRLAALAAREAELAAFEGQLQAQLAELTRAEAALRATMALADQAAEGDLTRLTAVFESMRPEQAAQVVAEMAPDFAAGLLARLRPEVAGAILGGVEPRLAYGLSAILAGRNADVPRP